MSSIPFWLIAIAVGASITLLLVRWRANQRPSSSRNLRLTALARPEIKMHSHALSDTIIGALACIGLLVIAFITFMATRT